jgi:hypothetical protein
MLVRNQTMVMEQSHRVMMPLGHRVDTSELVQYLVQQLDCDSWYVASQREQLLVLHLTKDNVKRFAVSMECTAPVEKGIYHGGHASSLCILPLGEEPDLPAETVRAVRSGLADLAATVHLRVEASQ